LPGLTREHQVRVEQHGTRSERGYCTVTAALMEGSVQGVHHVYAPDKRRVYAYSDSASDVDYAEAKLLRFIAKYERSRAGAGIVRSIESA
jgi:hypothetical protein